jgi:hypothetical protein
VSNLVSHTKGTTYIEGSEENIGPKRKEVAGGWRRLHKEELLKLYASTDINYYGDQVTKDEMGGACSTHGDEKCIQHFYLKS